MARKKHHEEHPDERWLLTYADMITLLMALFMVLYAMSMVNKTKFEALRLTLKQSFSAAILTGGTSVLDHGAKSSSQSTPQSEISGQDTPVPESGNPAPSTSTQQTVSKTVANASAAQAAEARQETQLDGAKEKVDQAIRAAHLQQQAKAFIDPRRGLVIRLVTDKVLFDLGSYTLRPAADPLLGHIAAAIQPLPNEVHVEGYTDSIPCDCEFGNTGLSFKRAATVLDYMGGHGFSVTLHNAVPIPYGDRFPLAPNSATAGNPRNRRVEIVIVRNTFATASAKGPLGNAVGDGAINAAGGTGTATP
jgi:chemotaxis protein MotB